MARTDVIIPADGERLSAAFEPAGAGDALAIFAHGSAACRHDARHRQVAEVLRRAGIGTLLLDLLTHDEEVGARTNGRIRYDIALLAARLEDATRWARAHCSSGRGVAIGYLAASTGSAAALRAAARLGDGVGAVVSRSGRPDLAGPDALGHVAAPTLLVVGALDYRVIDMNEAAYEQLVCEKELALVPDAGHHFYEPLALPRVAALAADWFRRHLLGAAEGWTQRPAAAGATKRR